MGLDEEKILYEVREEAKEAGPFHQRLIAGAAAGIRRKTPSRDGWSFLYINNAYRNV